MMDNQVVEEAPHQVVVGDHHHIEMVLHGKEDKGDPGEMEDLEGSEELEDQEVQAALVDLQDHHHRPGKVGQMI